MLAEGLDLEFGSRTRDGVYVLLLNQLLDAPKGSVLKCDNPKARYSVIKAARKVNVTVAYAEKDGALYVKITGMQREAGSGAPAAAVDGQVQRRVTTAQNPLLAILARAEGPMTLKEVAWTMGTTPISCAEALTRLEESGQVECDAGVYRLKAQAKRVA